MIRRIELDTVDFSGVTTGAVLPDVIPGEIVKTMFMEPLGLSARDLGVPANRITGIINGTRSITAETALPLGRRFGMTAELWMNLRTAHELEAARRRMPALT